MLLTIVIKGTFGEIAMAIPLPIRRLIVETRDNGVSISGASKLFQISEATVKRITRQWRTMGTLEAGKSSGRKPILDESAGVLIQQRLRDDNDLSLGALSELLVANGYSVTPQAVFYRLKQMGLSYQRHDAKK